MKLIFAGTPANAALALERLSAHHEIVLVITRQDAPSGRKRELRQSPVAETAQRLGLKVLKANKLGAAEAERIVEAGANLAIVVAYGALVPESILSILPWWNLHFSLLPMWRGATPLQHSILSGGDGAGISLFKLDKGLDTGPLIAQQRLEIDFEKTSGELLPIFTEAGVSLILDALSGQSRETAQVGDASYAPKLQRSDARLNFENSATEISRKVMALNPEPMAWCELLGEPIRILRARSLGETNWDALAEDSLRPGSLEISTDRVLVACGSGTRLELVEVQPAGKKPMNAKDWARGLNGEVRFD